MATRSLEALERHAGILIPDCVHDFFRNPHPLGDNGWWEPYPLKELLDLSGVFPNHPLGCIPLLRDAGGNDVCLYYRGVEDPLLAARSGEDNILHPLDDQPDAFFTDPDRYDNRRGWVKRARKKLPRWDALRITDVGNPIEQILKPFEIEDNRRLFEKEFSEGLMYSRKSRVLKGLLDRLKEANESDEAVLCIQRAFSYSSPFKDWFHWFRLGCRLIDLRDSAKAIAVLSNAAFVAMEFSPMWSKVLMVAHKLEDALSSGGPLPYRRQVARWMPWLKEWQAEE